MRIAVLGLVLSAVLAAQTPAPARDGVITGQVVDGATGRPVSAAIVTINGAGLPLERPGTPGVGFVLRNTVPRILTGSDGRFAFRDLPAGSFTIVATKGGYADGASGRRVIAGPSQPVIVSTAQKNADVLVRIWKNASIAGTIVDEAGEPMIGLQVRAARRTFAAGRRRFGPAGGSATTDDRGAYRFSGLLPGEYLILTSPPPLSANVSVFAGVSRSGGGGVGELAALLPPGGVNGIQVGATQLMVGRGGAIPPPPIAGRVQIYPPIFYPSAFAPAQATVITLSSGEERAGVDLQLQPVTTARVSGTVIGPAGPAAAVTLRLVPTGVDEMAADSLAPVSFSDGAGAFTFAAVPPGQYTLRASAPLLAAGPTRAADMYWLAMPMAVAGDDVDGVVAVMRPSLRITGRLQFDGATPRPPEQSRVMFVGAPFMLESADDNAPPPGVSGQTGTAADGGVTLGGYPAGKYRVRVTNSPAGWMFKAAMLNGVDVSETAFEFTRDVTDLVLLFTDRWSGIGGIVRGANADGAMVIAFTTNSQAWNDQGTSPRRLKSTRANPRGEFGLSSVPPGDYYVIAVPEDQAGDWRDPKVLEALARQATQVTVGDGEHKTIDLTVKEVR